MPPDIYLSSLQQQQAEGGAGYAIAQELSQALEVRKLWRAANPANKFSIEFSPESVRINNNWGIKVFSSPTEQTKLDPVSSGNRLEYRHANGLSEWFVNGPLGLEQGFTLRQALPETTQDGWLNLPVSFENASLREIGPDNPWLQLVGANGELLGQYGKLYAAEASGQVLESHLERAKDGREAILRVKVAGASYPVTIDPFVQQARLVADDGAAYDNYGFALALSGDGNTALVGAYGNNANHGAVYVYTRTGSVWAKQTKLIASDGAIDAYLGWSVALSSDGNTALVGAPYTTINGKNSQGATYVFTRSGTNWTQQTKFIATDGNSADDFGAVVALSGDGTTALIAAPPAQVGAVGYYGAVYPFTLSGNNWTQHGRITLPDGGNYPYFGNSLALNNNGTVAIIGSRQPAVGTPNTQGAAYIYTGSGGSYTQQLRLPSVDDNFGYGVALNGAGNIALIGADGAKVGSYYIGAAYIFTGSGSSWTQQAKLTASDGAIGDAFGEAVALSTDGKTALIGNNYKQFSTNHLGAAYIFTSSGSNWTQQTSFTGSDSTASGGDFAWAVAINGDGTTALVSDKDLTVNSNTAQGAAYIFNKQLITTTTGLASSANPSTLNHNVTFTAPISPTAATGTVAFTIDGTPTFTSTVTNGQATYTTASLGLGNHTVSAAYSGNSTYAASVSPTITQVVSTCAPLMVTAASDNGAGACGTLSYALAQPVSGSTPVTITFDLTGGGNIITFTGTIANPVKAGVTIFGGNFGTSTRIVINGNDISGDGLHLSGNNYLVNLTIENFGGWELVLDGKANKVQGVVIIST